MGSVVGVDATAAAAAAEVRSAETALRGAAAEEPGRWWSAYELKVQARNGWSAAAMSVALNQMIADGILELANGDQVRLNAAWNSR